MSRRNATWHVNYRCPKSEGFGHDPTIENSLIGEKDSPLDRTPEFAHVPWPPVPEQHRFCTWRQLGTSRRSEITGQQYDIAPTLVERQQRKYRTNYPLHQIISDQPIGDLITHILLDCCDDAEAALPLGCLADSTEILVVQDSKKLALRFIRHTAKLIEKQGTIVRILDQARYTFDCTAERPFAMTI